MTWTRLRLADRIAIMENGRIIQIGTPEELVIRPATEYVRRFVAKVPPARVIRVAALIQPGPAPAASISVGAEATISEIAGRLVAGNQGLIAVTDLPDTPLGSLDRQRALEARAVRA